MRGKKAKAIRREAEWLTVRLPDRRLVRGPHGENINLPGCTRSVYRKMKRATKGGKG